VHVAALRPRVAARTVDKTGLDALRRDLAVTSPAGRLAITASLGPHWARSRPAPLPAKL